MLIPLPTMLRPHAWRSWPAVALLASAFLILAASPAAAQPDGRSVEEIVKAYGEALQRGDVEAEKLLVIEADHALLENTPFAGSAAPDQGSVRVTRGENRGPTAYGEIEISGGGQTGKLFVIAFEEAAGWRIALAESQRFAQIDADLEGATPGRIAAFNTLAAERAGNVAGSTPDAASEPAAASSPAPAAKPVFLISLFKPVVFLILVSVWGWIAGRCDKDAEYYFLKRYEWSGIHLGCAVFGFGALLLIPIFWAGLPVALLILGGGIGGYVFYRNGNVPAGEKWTLDIQSYMNKSTEMRQAAAQHSASVVLMAKDETPLDVPVGDDPALPAHQALEAGLDFTLPRGGEQIELVVDAEKAKFTARIDGVRHALPQIAPAVGVAMVDYVKKAAGLDVQERRKKQVGLMRCDHSTTGRHVLEVQTAGSTRGLSMLLRIDPGAQVGIEFAKLGLAPVQIEPLKAALDQPGGMVLVSAPPKHGTTTTLYSLAQEHDPYTSSVMTWEDEVAYEIEGVNHNVIPSGTTPEQFNQKLAAMLRSDPNVMMLGWLADAGTAKMLAEVSDEVRAYVPLFKDDAMSALIAWIKVLGDAKLASQSLRAVVAQRLVRRLCPMCRQAYTPDPAALKKLNLPPDKVSQLYRASGKVTDEKGRTETCPSCLGMGYRGRVAVFETIVIDDQARQLIATNQGDKLKAHLRKNRMLYMQESALAKVVEGVTDIKEISRALAEGKK